MGTPAARMSAGFAVVSAQGVVELWRAAAADAATAQVILARASIRAGAHAAALPVLEVADQLADAVWFAGHVHAEDPGLPGVDRQQGGEHAQGRRLPRAVGTEDAEDLALAYMKADSVDRAKPAEGLDQVGGVNGLL